MRIVLAAALVPLVSMVLIGAAHAQTSDYPSRPVRIVVPFAPGGGNDLLARVIGDKLRTRLGQPFVIENRPGAGGNIGADFVAKAPPDGYTLLLATNTLAMSAAITPKLPFDARTDFTPVAMLAATPFVLLVNPGLPARSVQELLGLARQRPGQLAYASVGTGTPHHFGMELLQQMTKTDLVHVPYRGSVPALTDVVSGQVQVMLASINAALPFMQSGKVRALGVGETKRLPWQADLPTIAEAGVAGFEINAWYAFLAPAKLSEDIRRRLEQESVRALGEADARERLQPAGFDVTPGAGALVSRALADDLGRFARIARAANIKAD